MALQDALQREILSQLRTLEKDRDENLTFVRNSMIGMVDPMTLSSRAMGHWTKFLNIASSNQGELRAFVHPMAAAAGMQMLYTRLVMLWQELPDCGGKLHKDLTDAVKSQVPAYVEMIT